MTEKFSYSKEFQEHARICKVGKDFDEFAHYMILVGDPDLEFTFLELGKFFSAEPFTTYTDAKRAYSLVQKTLELVDENISLGLKLADVRDEILAEVSKKFDIDGDPDDPDLLNLRPAVEGAIERIFNYYIETGE